MALRDAATMESSLDPASGPANDDPLTLSRLHDIVERRLLHAVFQPIVNIQTGEIFAYEGLIRGPSDSPLHLPSSLFKHARANNLTVKVEHLCRGIVLKQFAHLKLPGKLCLNVSPECLLQSQTRHDDTLGQMREIGIDPQRVIIELTEQKSGHDYELLRQAIMHYQEIGFEIAIDDLGEGFSSLRLWSELRPEYVKIDKYFAEGIHLDPVKRQFARSIQEIAEKSGTIVIAEGIETLADLLLIRELGITHGQGYHIARPNDNPAVTLSADIATALCGAGLSHVPGKNQADQQAPTALKLLRAVPAISPSVQNDYVYELFVNNPELHVIPVVENDAPIGLINRFNMIDRLARPYQRELYGRKSCMEFIELNPLVTDKDTSLQDLSHLIVESDPHHLYNGFVITDQGRYLGMGTGHDLIREITQMQIHAARHANPLTLLPGNAPINERITGLLHNSEQFFVCYGDLDHFKPYNDAYGYLRGDDVIQLTGKILARHCNQNRDFIGHIGGDDFIVLFQSEDWELRCRAILDAFDEASRGFYNPDDFERRGYWAENRQGEKELHPLISLSLGVVKIESAQCQSHHQIAGAAAEAKKQAKKIHGNSLFIERRSAAQS